MSATTKKFGIGRFVAVLLMAFACCAVTFTLSACGQSKPETLEEYFAQDPNSEEALQAQADELAETMTNQLGLDCGASIDVVENQMQVIMRFNLTTEEMIGDNIFGLFTGKNASEALSELLINSISEADVVETIKQAEEDTGISGITIAYQYRDASGNPLATSIYDRTGRIQ